jgi:hypothetical protein
MFIELPLEDAEEGMCRELQKSTYRTRDAAQNWEREYCEYLEGIGFTRGRAPPCAFHHEGRDLRAAVHGDDFTALGWEK